LNKYCQDELHREARFDVGYQHAFYVVKTTILRKEVNR
jgi:hypothetical protein